MSIHVTIQYKVLPDQVEENEKAVAKFLEGIREVADPKAKYTSYKLPDGVSFMHFGWFADEDAKARFQAADHFKEFAAGLPGRCEVKPNVTPLSLIASSEDFG